MPVAESLGTPVALFGFNRPDCTLKVLNVIRRVRPRTLFLIADGPRANRPVEAAQCLEVRRILGESIDWPCEIHRDFADRNLGCRERIVSGLTGVFARVERAIILEDDCVPEETFFPYCEELLERYRDDQRIGMLTGTNYRPELRSARDSYFFARHHSIWGWATWRRAFSGFDATMEAWRQSVSPVELESFWADSGSRRVHRSLFDLCRSGTVDTWDIPWVFHLARKRMLSVVPGVNQVSNIGIAGTRGQGDNTNTNLPTGPLTFPLRHPGPIEPDLDYDRFVSRRHRLVRDHLRARWFRRIKKLFNRL